MSEGDDEFLNRLDELIIEFKSRPDVLGMLELLRIYLEQDKTPGFVTALPIISQRMPDLPGRDHRRLADVLARKWRHDPVTEEEERELRALMTDD